MNKKILELLNEYGLEIEDIFPDAEYDIIEEAIQSSEIKEISNQLRSMNSFNNILKGALTAGLLEIRKQIKNIQKEIADIQKKYEKEMKDVKDYLKDIDKSLKNINKEIELIKDPNPFQSLEKRYPGIKKFLK